MIKINFLRIKLSAGVILFNFIFLNTHIIAQNNKWKTNKYDDDEITVGSHISKRINENGKKLPLLEFKAVLTDSLDFQNCILVLKDILNHKKFLKKPGVKNSEIIDTVSQNEWIIYYLCGDHDIVAHMVYFEKPSEKTAGISLTAVPDYIARKNIRRSTYYNLTYTLKSISDDEVEITLTANMSAVRKAPLWIIRLGLPQAAADVVRSIAKLAKEK